MPKHRILMCEFPGFGITHPDVAGWVGDTRILWDRDPDIGPGNHGRWHKIDTPVTMSRNIALKFALRENYDYVCFVDADLSPDLPYEGAKPFWQSSWDFIKQHNGPCIIAAPYCGPPPFEMPYVFKYTNMESENPNPDFQIQAYSRNEAAVETGIKRVAALPTGLMIIDMRIVRKLRDPYFYYEYHGDSDPCGHCGARTPGQQIQKASTEDVAFCRDIDMMGFPLYCNFDAWAGHWKMKRVGKPIMMGSDVVSMQVRGRAAELDAELKSRLHSEKFPPIVPTAGILQNAVDGELPKLTNRVFNGSEFVEAK